MQLTSHNGSSPDTRRGKQLKVLVFTGTKYSDILETSRAGGPKNKKNNTKNTRGEPMCRNDCVKQLSKAMLCMSQNTCENFSHRTRESWTCLSHKTQYTAMWYTVHSTYAGTCCTNWVLFLFPLYFWICVLQRHIAALAAL